MAIKHTNLPEDSLSLMVGAAMDLSANDEVQKAKDKAEGRRSDLDDLPTGHPLRTMMDAAKKKYEEALQQKEQLKKAGEKEVKVVKKISKQQPSQQQVQQEDNQRKNDAAEYNSAADEVLSRMEAFGNIADSMSARFHGDMRQRTLMSRASRATQAAFHAIKESMVRK